MRISTYPWAWMPMKIALMACMGLTALNARGDARTDGTTGPVRTLSGAFTVDQSLGTVRGTNLFHSFQNFSVQSGESATFTTSGPLRNVIARVTGGEPSLINGMLQLIPAAGTQPNFYFINPAGVTFSADAVVDVPAGFHVSTAHFLKFADGNFYADRQHTSTLSAAAPEAFGFLTPTAGTLALNPSARIETRTGQGLSLVGGHITMNEASVNAPGGNIRIEAQGNVAITNGSSINSPGMADGTAGSVSVRADTLTIDGQGADRPTGIFSNAVDGNAKSGDVSIQVDHGLSLLNGGRIATSTRTAGAAGSVSVSAGRVMMEGGGTTTGILSRTSGNTGSAGHLTVITPGALTLRDGGQISSSTSGAGAAGSVQVRAGEIALDGTAGNGASTGISSVTHGGSGNAGKLDISTPGKLSIVEGANISSATSGAGNGGTVKVAAGALSIVGRGVESGINSISFEPGTGRAGSVEVNVTGHAELQSSAAISTSTFTAGNGGTVSVHARSMTIDGQALTTGIFSDSGTFRNPRSAGVGHGGAVQVTIDHALLLRDGGRISSKAFTQGDGGSVDIVAQSLQIVGKDSGIQTNTTGNGDAGRIAVKASDVRIQAGGAVTSSTNWFGNAGQVSVDADQLTIDGQGTTTGLFSEAGIAARGNAGSLQVQVAQDLRLVQGGQISTATNSYHSGSGGTVRVSAQKIDIVGDQAEATTGILSSAHALDSDGVRSRGNAGDVSVTARDQINLTQGGQITSKTLAQGAAGAVAVTAKNVTLQDHSTINSEAGADSSGQAGSVMLVATSELQIAQGANISIKTEATVANPRTLKPSLISIAAGKVSIDGASVTASSSGNIAASGIDVQYRDGMFATQGAITTAAVNGNGGGIRVSGNGPMVLERSQVTTSVTGTQNGNGGAISIAVPVLVLHAGFIQANTVAPAATGGNVDIQVQSTVASQEALRLGGDILAFDPAAVGRNVIQASAPDGINGQIQISNPVVDLEGSLGLLTNPWIRKVDLDADQCRIGVGSSLTVLGQGGLPPVSSGWIRPQRLLNLTYF